MDLFKKRTNLAQNIAFMAIMAAINVLFVLLTTFVPFLLFLLVFILPLSCTLVVLLCEKKYFPIYAFATIGLCLIVTLHNIGDTLFYIIPSIITGFVFAICIERKLPYTLSIILSSFVQFGLSYALLPLVKLITQVDLLESFSKLAGIIDNPYLVEIQITAVFLVSFMQEIISYLFIKLGLKKLNFTIIENKYSIEISLVGLLVNLLLTLLFVFVYSPISFVFFITSLYFAFFVVIWVITTIDSKWNYIILVLWTFGFIFLFAWAYKSIQKPFGILFIEAYLYGVGIIGFINNCLVKRK